MPVEGFFVNFPTSGSSGTFKSIIDLQADINRYLTETNENPKPFAWTADPHASSKNPA